MTKNTQDIDAFRDGDFEGAIAKGGSPGTHTPGWDKKWPPKPKPVKDPKLV